MNSGEKGTGEGHVLGMPKEAWDEGYASGLSGYRDDCPYSVTSRNGWAWSSGQIEGIAASAKRFPCQQKQP